ncbi:MAG TPA: DNA polymerase III subunit gamma/tau [Xanthobacteraceae bacterium]|nr:DNA polymerase III subunit gamma/tau [Xanthobacteraceae bacterium]
MNDATTPDDQGADAPGLALTAPAASGYRVLARKYRPASFDDLIGQDAMVRTVSNAFETGRIPQAWILTGVRGVGKTTTARILARALNYALADGSIAGPTIKMPALGLNCQAIMESRHVDVLEMDAASHNSVDDIRQINDAVRYAPVSARYKVYILDEVHMLSGAAFNALLKTLEEPPPHAKFIFATTEIRKVPVTVLSRCQRFDLRRVEAGALVAHLEGIAAKEGIATEPEAMALIARAAEGSVRDALSLLDQAIAHAAGGVRAEDVRQMLGLADRSRIIDLFEAVMRGDIAGALKELRDQYDAGADPAVVLADLAEFTHFVTRVKIVPAVADDRSLAEVERTRGRAFAAALSMRVLSRTWQMLFKGLPEVQSAGKPIAAAEMVLVRIAYAADLPPPDEVVRSLTGGEAPTPRAPRNGETAGPRADAPKDAVRGAPRAALAAAAPQRREPMAQAPLPQPAAAEPATIMLARFEDLIALAAERRDLQTKTALERDVRLVRFEPGRLEIALETGAAKTLVGDLARKITEWTGRRWMVAVSGEQGQPSIKSQNEARRAALERGVQADPLVKAVLAQFPGAQIVAVREGPQDIAPPSGDGDVMPPEPPADDGSSAFAEQMGPEDPDDAS